MSEKIYSKCGMRCDLCLIYRPNVEKEDRRTEICTAFKKIWKGFAPDPVTVICDGCNCEREDAVLFSPACETRKCVIEKGFVHCGHCEQYPCNIFPAEPSPEETFQKIEEKHFKLKEKIDKISIDTNGIRVILTVDGEDLIYENGEYYIFDTITKTKKRKLTKNQARELYIEYFIRYQLNPILENKKMKKMVKDISLKTRQQKETIAIEQAKTEKQKEEIKSKEKLIKKEAKTIDKKSKSKDIER